MSKKEQVFEFIRKAGRNGRSFSEIQRFIVELNGLNYDERDKLGRRRYRGYYCKVLHSWKKSYFNPHDGWFTDDNWIFKNKYGKYFMVT